MVDYNKMSKAELLSLIKKNQQREKKIADLTPQEKAEIRALARQLDNEERGVKCVHNKVKTKTACVPFYGHIFISKLREEHELSLQLGRYVPVDGIEEARKELAKLQEEEGP